VPHVSSSMRSRAPARAAAACSSAAARSVRHSQEAVDLGGAGPLPLPRSATSSCRLSCGAPLGVCDRGDGASGDGARKASMSTTALGGRDE
jgi:hypothetical protein